MIRPLVADVAGRVVTALLAATTLWGCATGGEVYPKPPIVSRLNLTTYPAFGSSIGALEKSLGDNTPVRVEGVKMASELRTRFQWSWSQNDDGSCVLDPPTWWMEMTLPVLEAPAELACRARAYSDALWLHEHGHVRLFLEEFSRFQRHIQMSETGPCDQIITLGNSLARGAADRYRNASDDYDKRTYFGETQGAYLHPKHHRSHGCPRLPEDETVVRFTF